MTQNKLTGQVVYLSKQRDFGFINSRRPDGCIEKFFFPINRVVFSEVEQDKIIVGMWARFLISEQPPKHPGDAKYAVGVEVFIVKPIEYDGHHWTDGSDQSTAGCRLCQGPVQEQVGGVK
jgi:hypothetical protein